MKPLLLATFALAVLLLAGCHSGPCPTVPEIVTASLTGPVVLHADGGPVRLAADDADCDAVASATPADIAQLAASGTAFTVPDGTRATGIGYGYGISLSYHVMLQDGRDGWVSAAWVQPAP